MRIFTRKKVFLLFDILKCDKFFLSVLHTCTALPFEWALAVFAST